MYNEMGSNLNNILIIQYLFEGPLLFFDGFAFASFGKNEERKKKITKWKVIRFTKWKVIQNSSVVYLN